MLSEPVRPRVVNTLIMARYFFSLVIFVFMNVCYGFDRDDWNTLMNSNKCERCDFSHADLSGKSLQGAMLAYSDLTHLDIDLDLEFIELTGVNLEGARFKDGVRCGSLPEAGGWGCSAATE